MPSDKVKNEKHSMYFIWNSGAHMNFDQRFKSLKLLELVKLKVMTIRCFVCFCQTEKVARQKKMLLEKMQITKHNTNVASRALHYLLNKHRSEYNNRFESKLYSHRRWKTFSIFRA